jgi:4-carboxymuconolactone decarboxylase
MARVPLVSRDGIPQQLQEAFDEVVSHRGANNVVSSGPTSVLINSPEAARRGVRFANFLADESSISAKHRELAILITARGLDCQFIWDAHAASGQGAGLGQSLINALRDNQPLPPGPADEVALITYGLEFFRSHRVSDATFNAALEQFGTETLVELTALMGYYSLLAFQSLAFAIDLPERRTEPLLPI